MMACKWLDRGIFIEGSAMKRRLKACAMLCGISRQCEREVC